MQWVLAFVGFSPKSPCQHLLGTFSLYEWLPMVRDVTPAPHTLGTIASLSRNIWSALSQYAGSITSPCNAGVDSAMHTGMHKLSASRRCFASTCRAKRQKAIAYVCIRCLLGNPEAVRPRDEVPRLQAHMPLAATTGRHCRIPYGEIPRCDSPHIIRKTYRYRQRE
jgi:hypothetical protein